MQCFVSVQPDPSKHDIASRNLGQQLNMAKRLKNF